MAIRYQDKGNEPEKAKAATRMPAQPKQEPTEPVAEAEPDLPFAKPVKAEKKKRR